MKHCKHCGFSVSTPENYCPICYNYLEKDDKNEEDKNEFHLYLERNKYHESKYTSNFLKKLFIFISFAISIIAVFINYFFQNSFNWSLVVVFSIIWVWIIVGHTIMSNRNIFEKIFFQLIALLALLWSLNNIAKGDWLINYVLPSIMIASTTSLVIISMIRKDRQNYILSFLIFYILFFIVSLIFIIFIKKTYRLLNYINLFYNGIVAIGTILFSFRIIKNEFIKKMHL